MKHKQKLSSIINCTVGVGILSWKSHKTLEKSLQSYEEVGFKDFFDQVTIIFQDISEEDKILAEKYGYEYVGINQNLGIQHGHQLIYNNIATDYVLVLENDNPIIEDTATSFDRILQALELLENGTIDIMRLRHRFKFGEGFSLEKYLEYFSIQNLHEKYCQDTIDYNAFDNFIKPIKRFLRPSKADRLAGYSLYFEKYPDKLFPEYIKKIEEDLYSVSSKIMTWTNQSVLLKRVFYGELLEYAFNNPSSRTANGFQDLEKPLNSKWWRDQNYQIGVGEGIFTHNRFDDSWRKSHNAFNQDII